LVQKEKNERENHNYPLIASNGPKLMDEIQWLKRNSWLRNCNLINQFQNHSDYKGFKIKESLPPR
jgi:hypothetical protein